MPKQAQQVETKFFNRNSFIFVVGGTTGCGKALIENMLHKVPYILSDYSLNHF